MTDISGASAFVATSCTITEHREGFAVNQSAFADQLYVSLVMGPLVRVFEVRSLGSNLT